MILDPLLTTDHTQLVNLHNSRISSGADPLVYFVHEIKREKSVTIFLLR